LLQSYAGFCKGLLDQLRPQHLAQHAGACQLAAVLAHPLQTHGAWGGLPASKRCCCSRS
jgi:hypothetical protein